MRTTKAWWKSEPSKHFSQLSLTVRRTASGTLCCRAKEILVQSSKNLTLSLSWSRVGDEKPPVVLPLIGTAR